MESPKPFTTENTENAEKSKTITQQRAEALVKKIGEACDELERLAEENPELVGRVTHGAEEQKEAYLRLKARLEMADAAPRCRWVRQDGTGCGSPQMKRHIYCFAHKQLAEAQALALMLPALEDANAIQIGIMRIQKAMIEGTISTKMAGLLLYSMQLALQNVKNVTFGHAKAAEPVTETVSVEEAFRQDQPQNQKLFTAKDAEDAEEERGLPRTDADERGLKVESGPVEWKPTPDMYRMDTREGMEAYEASFRMKIGTAPQGVIGPDDPGQVRDSSLRDERLPKGPRFASESLDADTAVGSVLQTEPYANLG